MSSDRHQRKSDLFLRAVELDPVQREAFLNDACADDPDLRADVERLLALDRTHFLTRPALGRGFHISEVPSDPKQTASHTELHQPTRDIIGNHRILGVLGEGGMGVVYRAEQINPRRPVALKVLRPGVADRDAIRRFELEAQVLGRLQHPNIAQVYEAGSFEDDRGKQPFLAMELVQGQPLAEYVKQHSLSITHRIELMLQICDAIEHAHQRGVIHRDLKPTNILVTEEGTAAHGLEATLAMADDSSRRAIPKVLDFGIARVISDDWHVTLVTNPGQLLGTLAYMSPEQFEIDPNAPLSESNSIIDTRTDVYSLGVLLYELLTDALPYEVHGKSIAHAVNTLRENDPKRIEQVMPVFRSSGWNDLSIIVAKAIERDRHRRYGSVGEFAADLRHFLAGEAITARPQTTLYQLRKFAKKHTEVVVGAVAVVVLLVLGIVGLSKYVIDLSRAKAVAEDARVEAIDARDAARVRSEELQQVADFQSAMLSDIDASLMGIQLREDLIEEFRAVHSRLRVFGGLATNGGDSQADAQSQLDQLQEEFEKHLTGINFTTAALRGLERNVFQRAIETIDNEFQGQPLVQARLFQSISDTLQSLGLDEQAQHPQKRAFAIRLDRLGDDHPDTLTSKMSMGYLLSGFGRFKEAEQHYVAALEGRRRALGEDHPETLLAKRRMASVLWMQGRPDEAIEFARAALEGYRRTVGEDDPRAVDALHGMAPLMHGIGDLDAALDYNRRALEGRKRLLGDDHPDTLISLNNMGIILASAGRIDDAVPYLKQALEGRLRVLGRNHRLTLQSKGNLARGLAELGRYDDAEPITRDVLEAYTQMYGEEHHHTINAMRNLGDILMDAGRFDDATIYVMRTLELCRAMLGDYNNETLAAMLAKIRLLRETGRSNQAMALGEELIQAMDESLPSDHPLRYNILKGHALTLAATQRFDEAEPLMLEAHRIAVGRFGPEHDRSRRAAQELTDLYANWRELATCDEVEAKLKAWMAEHVATSAGE